MYYSEHTTIYLDGAFIRASEAKTGLYNQTMHYGNGVFEGIRAYDTEDGVRIFKAKAHFDRLRYSAEKMGLPFSYSSEELEKHTYRLLELNGLKNAYIRPLLFGDEQMSLTSPAHTHLAIMAWPWDKYLGHELLRVMLSSYQRPNPQSCPVEAKVTGHYTNSILATNEAKAKGFDEALLTDLNGFIAEGPGANFFFERDEKLYTAPLGNILPGITRATVFELAKELGIEVVECFFKPEEIYSADTAFFCGTAAEIVGIKQFNNHHFPAEWEQTLSALLQRSYKRRVAHNEYQHVYI
jgi:branched-chain amino acid aminotransferase